MPTTILHKESLIPGRTSKLVLDAPQIAATAEEAIALLNSSPVDAVRQRAGGALPSDHR